VTLTAPGEHANGVSGVVQRADQVTADEAGAAEDAKGLVGHGLGSLKRAS
jgi:hypothetical protein